MKVIKRFRDQDYKIYEKGDSYKATKERESYLLKLGYLEKREKKDGSRKTKESS